MINRSQFLPAGMPDGDFPVPLSDTCSVPSARMAYLLAGLVGSVPSVLEIGTGSGYQTAVLAEQCKVVVSIEANPIPGLEDKLPENVALIYADGRLFNTHTQFDAILVTFGCQTISHLWIEQLKEGGKLVIPMQVGNSCQICVYEKRNESLFLCEIVAYAQFTSCVEPS